MTFKLYNEECLECMSYLPPQSVDMIMADLPYGTTQNKWDSVIPLEPLWKQYKWVCKPDAAILLTASQPFTSILGTSNIEWLRYAWIWKKFAATGHLNAKRMPMKDYEDVLMFCSGSSIYNPQGLKPHGKITRRGHNGGNFGKSGTENFQEFTNYPRLVLTFNSDSDKLHPTQKPVALMEYLIRTYTNPGDTVMDNTMGSGTTGVACMNTGRNFIGIERDPTYFEIAKKRIQVAWELNNEY